MANQSDNKINMDRVEEKTYKLCLVGDGGVGKTTYLNRLLSDNFTSSYTPTMGLEIHPFTYQQNLKFHIWDFAGKKFSYYDYNNDKDAFIVFFDVTKRNSYKNCEKWIEQYKIINPLAIFVLVGTKVDCPSRKVLPGSIKIHEKYNMPYYDISSKSNYNIIKPLEYIIKQLHNSP
jgi:GTP-binding nuclear protein Ran